MILVIKVNKHRLHDGEFVRPVTDLLDDFKVADYKKIKKEDLDKAKKVIICGTALKDNDYLENLDKFFWLKDFKKPVLGICAGMQIIGKVLGKELIIDKKICVFNNRYYLHSWRIKGDKDELKEKNFVGYMYHPEVLNKEVLIFFK